VILGDVPVFRGERERRSLSGVDVRKRQIDYIGRSPEPGSRGACVNWLAIGRRWACWWPAGGGRTARQKNLRFPVRKRRMLARAFKPITLEAITERRVKRTEAPIWRAPVLPFRTGQAKRVPGIRLSP